MTRRWPDSTAPLVQLRPVVAADLPIFHEQMHDAAAREMAAHAPRSGAAFFEHWRRIMADPDTWLSAVLVDGELAGHVAGWMAQGQRRVGYWIGRPWWGRGVATAALRQFLALHALRPLYAYVAKRNVGSMRVLEKCGFVVDEAATRALEAPADGIDERVYRLT